MPHDKTSTAPARRGQHSATQARISAHAPGSERRTDSSLPRRPRYQLQAGDIAATRTPGGQLG